MEIILNKKIWTIIIILLYIIGLQVKNTVYMNFLLMILIVTNIVKIFKSNMDLKIIYCFLLQYSYCFLEYFFFNKKISGYIEYNKFEYFYQGALLNFLFTMIFFIFSENLKNKKKIKSYNNKFILVINCIIFIYFLLTGVTNFKIGTYLNSQINPKIEYSLIIYLVISYFSSIRILNIINIIYFLYAIFLFSIGVRVPGIQIIFLIIIRIRPKFLYKNLKKINIKNIFKNNKNLFFISISIFILKIIEKIRNMNGSIAERIYFILTKTQNIKNKIIINNESEVIYSTNALLGLIDQKILILEDSFKSILAIFFNVFKIDYMVEYSNLPRMVAINTPIGGGGLISGYLYFLGREPLIIFVAILLGIIITNPKTYYLKIYSFIVIVTIFRWYAYTPVTLYKLSFYGVLWFWLNIKFHKIIKNKYI